MIIADAAVGAVAEQKEELEGKARCVDIDICLDSPIQNIWDN